MRSISVIIPNYNGKHLFERYFEKNLQIIFSLNIPTEVIVVDDGSEDSSVSYLKENYSEKIIIIEKKENTGFSNTCNIGFAAAKYSLIFFLNTDVSLTPTYFNHLLKYFDLPDTFGVMGRSMNMEDNTILEAARLPKINGQKIKPSNFFFVASETF